MEIKKIQVTKQRTLNIVYKEDNGDVVTRVGANVIHRDLRNAFTALVAHLAIITEQREAVGKNLGMLQAERIADPDENGIHKRLGVDGITLTDGEQGVSLQGYRILSHGVMRMDTPSVTLNDEDGYTYRNELGADIEAVKYEARQYLDGKYGIMQSELEFEDPFEGIEAGDVPEAEADGKAKRRTKKVA